jgi:hypothetical protein
VQNFEYCPFLRIKFLQKRGNYTTVNDLPNEFALTRLGKKVMWGGSHKVSSYQTLVKRPM